MDNLCIDYCFEVPFCMDLANFLEGSANQLPRYTEKNLHGKFFVHCPPSFLHYLLPCDTDIIPTCCCFFTFCSASRVLYLLTVTVNEASYIFLNDTLIFRAKQSNLGTRLVQTKSNIPPLLYRWQSTGTGCPERLWGLLPWRSSKADWAWSWAACCGRHCLNSRLDKMTARGHFQTKIVCNSMRCEIK